MAHLRPLLAAALAASLFVIPLAAVAAEPNPPQEGKNGDCLAFNVLWRINLADPAIVVDGGTRYYANQTGGAQIYVDFYDADGRFLGDNSNHPHMSPADASYGTVCVGVRGGGWPDLPAPHATWTYQDGF